MKFFQAILDFLGTIFNSSSPEAQKKLQRKKLEAELRAVQPVLYSNGFLQPNFAEAVRILYVNSAPLNEIFSETISGSDIQKRHRFESQLVLTSFSESEQAEVTSLLYEHRKADIANSTESAEKRFEFQHKTLEKIIKQLNDDSLKSIDEEINALHQLADLCRLNFVTILQTFDTNFSTVNISYKPSFQEMAVSRFAKVLEDLYYQISGLKIDSSVANAVVALATLKSGRTISFEKIKSLNENVKKIAYIVSRVLTADYIKKLICIAQDDLSYSPKAASYTDSARQNFVTHLQQQFQADEQRIKTELKNERIANDLSKIFNGALLTNLQGYEKGMDEKLQANTALSFSLITPLQILKTFLINYITEPIRALLNDIVIEGFFNNPSYKSDFSAIVFAVCESLDHVKAFEESFARGKEFDIAVLDGYIRDSKTDASFYTKMEGMVSRVNSIAQKLLQEEVNLLHDLFFHLNDLLVDAKKPSGEIITNLRLLMMSSRNRDYSDMLEQQLPKWETFFEIMKNFTIVQKK
ncbi:MAG: hypothetical protein IKI31_00020 [Treponema sp.]|nr:hypothetical protein [Treponema sp.]